MENNKAMSVAIHKAASGYAEKITRESGLIRKIQCPALDWAVRKMAIDLINAGVVDADAMYEFLDERQYRNYTPDIWWND